MIRSLRSDEGLMAAAGGGSREAVDELFDRYRDPLWRFLRRRVFDGRRAEELHQDVFVALLQGAARYEPRSSFRSYIFGIAYNILLADRRKERQARHAPLDADPPAVTPDPEGVLWVRRALATLDPDQREIVMLREYEQRFVGQMELTGTAGAGRSLRATLRIPAARLEGALQALRNLGQIVDESQSGDHVTEQMIDLEARLANARNTEKRLNDVLLNRTGKVGDVLEVERELARGVIRPSSDPDAPRGRDMDGGADDSLRRRPPPHPLRDPR